MAVKQTAPQVITATTSITKATGDLTQAVNQLTSLVETSDVLQQQIESKKEEISLLETQFAEQYRVQKLDLDLKVKGDYKAVVTDYVTTNDLVLIPVQDHLSLVNASDRVKTESESSKKAALSELESRLKSNFASETSVLKSQQAAVLAEANARNVTLQDKVTFLQNQVDSLLVQLSEQRQAEIDKVKAANPVQNITNVTDAGSRK